MDSIVNPEILNLKNPASRLAFVAKDVYLHFLDRELLTSAGIYDSTTIDSATRTFLYTLLSGQEKLYFSASLAFENQFAEAIFFRYPNLFKIGKVELCMKEFSLQDFILKKQDQYSHAKEHYPFYFDDRWKGMHDMGISFRPKQTDTTKELENTMIPDLKSRGIMTLANRFRYELNLKDVVKINPHIIDSIQGRGKKAITRLLFQEHLTEVPQWLVRVVNLKISEHYIKSYLKEYGATIATGLQFPLRHFDYLCDTFPFRDTQLWRKVYDRIGLCNHLERLNDNQLIELTQDNRFIAFVDAVRLFWFVIVENYLNSILDNPGSANDQLLLQSLSVELIPFLKPYPFKKGNLPEILCALESQTLNIREKTHKHPLTFPTDYYDMKAKKDLGIVIALEEEFRELFQTITDAEPVYDEKTKVYFYEFSINGLSAVAILIGAMGHTEAALTTKNLTNKYQIDTIISMGLCGALSDEIHLGDVIVGDQIDDYMFESKIEGKEMLELKFHGKVFQASEHFITHAKNLEFAHKPKFEEYKSNGAAFISANLPKKAYDKLLKSGLIEASPKLKTGDIASGPAVSSSEKFNVVLSGRNRKYAGIEMEAFGVLRASKDAGCNTLVIRCVSDYADERKKELDKMHGAVFRKYAMFNSINALKAFVELNFFKKG